MFGKLRKRAGIAPRGPTAATFHLITFTTHQTIAKYDYEQIPSERALRHEAFKNHPYYLGCLLYTARSPKRKTDQITKQTAAKHSVLMLPSQISDTCNYNFSQSCTALEETAFDKKTAWRLHKAYVDPKKLMLTKNADSADCEAFEHAMPRLDQLDERLQLVQSDFFNKLAKQYKEACQVNPNQKLKVQFLVDDRRTYRKYLDSYNSVGIFNNRCFEPVHQPIAHCHTTRDAIYFTTLQAHRLQAHRRSDVVRIIEKHQSEKFVPFRTYDTTFLELAGNTKPYLDHARMQREFGGCYFQAARDSSIIYNQFILDRREKIFPEFPHEHLLKLNRENENFWIVSEAGHRTGKWIVVSCFGRKIKRFVGQDWMDRACSSELTHRLTCLEKGLMVQLRDRTWSQKYYFGGQCIREQATGESLALPNICRALDDVSYRVSLVHDVLIAHHLNELYTKIFLIETDELVVQSHQIHHQGRFLLLIESQWLIDLETQRYTKYRRYSFEQVQQIGPEIYFEINQNTPETLVFPPKNVLRSKQDWLKLFLK